ncbi:MAG: hypothetical protein K2H56_00110 [Malacoplasma sp.]|nr:hypothetical protein [Malacoplasma sp.]
MGNRINNFKRKIKTKIKRTSLSIKSFNFSVSKKLKYLLLMHWTFPKKIFLGILIIFIFGAILLYTPWAINYESYTYVNNEYVFKLSQVQDINGFVNQPLSEPREFHYNFLQAIFTSASAFTNTGLTIVSSIGSDFSIFGQFVVFVLIEVGGFGYASLFYLLGKMIRKISKKDLFSTSLLNIERGGTKVSDSSKMIVKIFFIMIIFQLIFTFILSGFFYLTPLYEQQSWENLISRLSPNATFDIGSFKGITLQQIKDVGNDNLFSLSFDNTESILIPTHNDYGKSFWYAMFISCSSINNAGFDLFGSTSLQLLRNDYGIPIQFIVLILVFLGGIGFPVLYDISIQLEWFWKYKIMFKVFKKKEYSRIIKPKLSNFAKLCLLSALIVSVISILILFLTEYVGSNNHLEIELSQGNGKIIKSNVSLMNYPDFVIVRDNDWQRTIKFWGNNPSFNKNFSVIFNALCCRSAGFSTVNFQSLSEASIVIFSILMFIGTSPSSTGGGIRTTTLFIIFKSLFSWFRGVERTSVFKRKVPIKTINNSYLVFLSGLVLVSFLTIVMYVTSNHTILNNNLVKDFYSNKGKVLDFSSFFFEACSAFGTSGNSFGITGSSQIQAWNLIILMILMFIGQMGVSSSLLLFARKTPKKRETFYLEEDIRIG